MIGSAVTIVIDYFWYHALTIAVLLIIGFLIAVHHYGSETNLRLAKQTQSVLHPFLLKNYSDYDGELVVESPNVLKVYASGRENCLFAIYAYAMVPRQQIISFLFNNILIGLKDELVIEIPILNEAPISLTMAIIRKKNIKLLTKKKYPDIKQLCKEYHPLSDSAYTLPDTHSILVQKVEHVKYLLYGQNEVQLWKEHGRSVKMLYMSDVNRFSRYPMTVRMVVNLGKDVLPLVEWLMSYVDRMSKIRMSSGERKEARKRREGLNLLID